MQTNYRHIKSRFCRCRVNPVSKIFISALAQSYLTKSNPLMQIKSSSYMCKKYFSLCSPPYVSLRKHVCTCRPSNVSLRKYVCACRPTNVSLFSPSARADLQMSWFKSLSACADPQMFQFNTVSACADPLSNL